MYAMLASSRGDLGQLIVRPESDPKTIDLALWKTLQTTLPPHSVWRVSPWVQSYQEGVRSEQFLSLLFSLLGIASLLLGAAGLFSVISYIAGQRNREFAVRIALGATKSNVLNLVMKEALVMALGGTAVGAGLGMWAGFLLWNNVGRVPGGRSGADRWRNDAAARHDAGVPAARPARNKGKPRGCVEGRVTLTKEQTR
jgi:hypothetical protein